MAYRQYQKGLAFYFFLEDLEARPPLGLHSLVVATRWHEVGPAPLEGACTFLCARPTCPTPFTCVTCLALRAIMFKSSGLCSAYCTLSPGHLVQLATPHQSCLSSRVTIEFVDIALVHVVKRRPSPQLTFRSISGGAPTTECGRSNPQLQVLNLCV